jgi:hypothetical protein
MRIYSFIIFFQGIILLSCHNQKIETENSLQKPTLNLIKSLGLLENDEKIIKYYSNFEKNKAGSFFTSRRIAHYWLDKYDKSKNDTSFAFYENISSIDTVYEVPDTFSPYMKITKSDNTEFKIYVDVGKEETKLFFEDAIKLWKQKK